MNNERLIQIIENEESEYIKSCIKNISRKNSFTSNILCSCARILIVDDDSMCRGYLSNVLRLYGHEYQTATNGQEAVNYIENILKNKCKSCKDQNFIIFMDVHMPIMNGIDATIRIDEMIINSKYKINCNVYIVSGNVEGQYIESLLNISIFKERYGKPIDKRSIRSILDRF